MLALKGLLFLKAYNQPPKRVEDEFGARTDDYPGLSSNAELSVDKLAVDFEVAKEFARSVETGEITCLQKITCENYERAEKYIAAGRILLGGARAIQILKRIGSLSRYEFIELAMIEAINTAKNESWRSGSVCRQVYPC